MSLVNPKGVIAQAINQITGPLTLPAFTSLKLPVVAPEKPVLVKPEIKAIEKINIPKIAKANPKITCSLFFLIFIL